ncbi:TetR/AcrR family transcriptional regulator [Salinibacterium sp. ZJ454]|uniref:TetR/AcrR family transcriptional regulator n=1 Tax=Salinibacterium sp. ZJ454 TaxID=2708339 RepID=UPI0014219CD9|nr:TetR/AcrR family transcriptional regulator [Salinibacterium sp. ZJ454]
MATLRDLHKQQTRKLLMETALELFQSKGYAPTTIDDIAGTAGTTRTTFYLHFSSKSQLMSELITEVDAILTAIDDPPLDVVVELGRRDQVEQWLNSKFDQWPVIRPYLMAADQASGEPEVAAAIEKWFEHVAEAMESGLDRAGRFEQHTRRIRCILAFGQFEYLSRRWFRVGWVVPREICLQTLTDAWCHLLVDDATPASDTTLREFTGRDTN